MKVTVIIPVYQAGAFLVDAIESALNQKEVSEILLIEDGSTDGGPEICRRYTQTHPGKVLMLQHPDQINAGAGASRNLGIQHARCPFIAFLDADDYYLGGRFTRTAEMFAQYPEADGIYEPVVRHHQDGQTSTTPDIIGLPKAVVPGQLFQTLATARSWHIHLNGLTLRLSAFSDEMLFDATLKQCQDSDFILRWAAKRRLYGGDMLSTVAIHRLHRTNRIHNTEEALHYRFRYLEKCALTGFYGTIDKSAMRGILNKMARTSPFIRRVRAAHLPVTPFRLLWIFGYLMRHPKVWLSLISYQYL